MTVVPLSLQVSHFEHHLDRTVMHTGSAECHDRIRQAIDDEIISLELSIRVLKSRRNALAPISRLPPETLAAIFSFLSHSTNKEASRLKWICVSHVSRQWRETALNYPRLWSHINLSKRAPAAIAEILSRAKMAPLNLEVDLTRWKRERIDAFERQLDAHMSHTRHLRISGPLPPFEQLVSSAPTLESLSLSHKSGSSDQAVIPINLFNCTAPSLTSLELVYCNISWKSPLLTGLQTLKIFCLSEEARPKLEDWLDALSEMPKLATLSLHFASPVAPLASLISESLRTITLPSLTKFYIAASAKDCALALAHLMMPALISLDVAAESNEVEGEDVRPLIPYVAQNVCGLQDTEPLRSIMINGDRTHARVYAWTMADADLDDGDSTFVFGALFPPRLSFVAEGIRWHPGVDIGIFNALLTLLPVNSVSSFTAERPSTQLSKEFWLSQAPRWPLLEQVRLGPTAVKAFRNMLAEDAPPDGPRLPSLTKLILINVTLTVPRTCSLGDMLIERVEQGVPLKVLDLLKCTAPGHAIRLLREIVVDVKEPLAEYRNRIVMWEPELFNLHREIGYWNEVEFNTLEPLYIDLTYDEDEDDEDDEDDDANEDDEDDEEYSESDDYYDEGY